MMARSRTIKPGFFQNEQLAECTPLERLAFIGMWTIADFKGCLEFRPKRLKIQLLPYDDCDFEKIAINLDKSGLIRKYSVQGNEYIKIINFVKHQNPHKNERESGSDIPDFKDEYAQPIDLEGLTINPDKSRLIQNNPEQDGTAPAYYLLPITDSLLPITDSLNLDSRLHTTENAINRDSVCVDEPAEKIKAKANRKTSEVQTILIEYGITGPLANDFITHRKHCGKNGKGAPITRTALEGFQREADSAGISIIEAIRTSIERNWVGFKADWIKPEIRGKPNVINHEFNDVPAKLARSIRNSQRWLEESEND